MLRTRKYTVIVLCKPPFLNQRFCTKDSEQTGSLREKACWLRWTQDPHHTRNMFSSQLRLCISIVSSITKTENMIELSIEETAPFISLY